MQRPDTGVRTSGGTSLLLYKCPHTNAKGFCWEAGGSISNRWKTQPKERNKQKSKKGKEKRGFYSFLSHYCTPCSLRAGFPPAIAHDLLGEPGPPEPLKCRASRGECIGGLECGPRAGLQALFNSPDPPVQPRGLSFLVPISAFSRLAAYSRHCRRIWNFKIHIQKWACRCCVLHPITAQLEGNTEVCRV